MIPRKVSKGYRFKMHYWVEIERSFFSRVILSSQHCCYSISLMECKAKMVHNSRWDISIHHGQTHQFIGLFHRKRSVYHSSQLWRKSLRHRIRGRLGRPGSRFWIVWSWWFLLSWDRFHLWLVQDATGNRKHCIFKRNGSLIVTLLPVDLSWADGWTS